MSGCSCESARATLREFNDSGTRFAYRGKCRRKSASMTVNHTQLNALEVHMRILRIFTWPARGRYLYYLTHLAHDIYIPVKRDRPPSYNGLPPGGFRWPDNIREVPFDHVSQMPFDCVL